MQGGKEIKVIKRAERRAAKATLSQKGAAEACDLGESGRDAVTVVTGWIRELRQKKVAEAARGFESLFSKRAANATQG